MAKHKMHPVTRNIIQKEKSGSLVWFIIGAVVLGFAMGMGSAFANKLMDRLYPKIENSVTSNAPLLGITK